MLRISSSNNDIIKKVNFLKTTKGRKETNCFLVEGEKLVFELTDDDWEIEFYIVTDEFSSKQSLNRLRNNVKTYIVSDSIFKNIADTVTPQGILAVVKMKHFDVNSFVDNDKNDFVILLEEISDPGNLGTVIRTADAVAASGIFISKNSVDIYNPKVIRSTMGSVFHIPIFDDVDLGEIIERLKKKNFTILAAHLKGEKFPYEFNLTSPCAVLIGNEAHGISDSISNKANALVKIPMLGRAESLNASVACGVLIYEVVRQRLQASL